MNKNLCKTVITNGGNLVPLLVPHEDSRGVGLMNPSVYIDGDQILVNVRNVNYTLWHCEGEQRFINRWGPLAYLNPENDVKLKTINFITTLDNDLNIQTINKVDTTALDSPTPLWEFHGLEDARLVRWDGKLYMSGVRRDTTPNGQGRIELSEIVDNKEISRIRIEPPGDSTYCEKNWMPILDMPYHYVKWSNPTEVIKVNIDTKQSETIYNGNIRIGGLPDFRGGSQVIPWNGYRISLVHEVNLYKNRLGQKDATYLHRFIVWNKDWQIIKITDPFSFMTGQIEFCCGMAEKDGDLLVSFGFQDNVAYLLKIPKALVGDLLGFHTGAFDWGGNPYTTANDINREVNIEKIYEKYQQVKEGDIVMDIGANVGAFSYSILNKNPKKIYCVEPSKVLIDTLKKNIKSHSDTVFINKAVSDSNGISELNGKNVVYVQFEGSYETTTFKSLIEDNHIDKIDFLKIDCEGGEYDIFTKENVDWIRTNIKHIAAEFHLRRKLDEINKFVEPFIEFRDLYLTEDTPFYAVTDFGEDVSKSIFNNEFIYDFVKRADSVGLMIYITNHA